jgi:hypothetical protein
MTLLHDRDEKMTARVEVKRLSELPPAELAAAIMPVFGPEGPPVKKIWWGARGIEAFQICDWLMRDHGGGYRRAWLWKAIARALHLLADAGLIENARRWTRVGAIGATLQPTELGKRALAEGTVRERLGLS